MLQPLADIAPTARDPVSGLTVAEILRRQPPGPALERAPIPLD